MHAYTVLAIMRSDFRFGHCYGLFISDTRHNREPPVRLIGLRERASSLFLSLSPSFADVDILMAAFCYASGASVSLYSLSRGR